MKYSNTKRKNMSEEKRIVIELSNIRAKKHHKKDGNHNHILLDS